MDPAQLIEKIPLFISTLIPENWLSSLPAPLFPAEFSALYVVAPLVLAFALLMGISLARRTIQQRKKRRNISNQTLVHYSTSGDAANLKREADELPATGLINRVRTTEASSAAHRERILDIELA